MKFSEEVLAGYEVAKEARLKAYAKYSNFYVGTALKIKGHKEFISGCNVENSSYGATNCAERSAVFSAISQFGKCEFDYLVLVTDTHRPLCYPCALCLQVLSEFCPAGFPIYVGNLDGLVEKTSLGELLPRPFNDLLSIKV